MGEVVVGGDAGRDKKQYEFILQLRTKSKGWPNHKGALRRHFTAQRSMLCSVYRPEQHVYKPVPKRKGRRFHFVYYYYLFITSTNIRMLQRGTNNIYKLHHKCASQMGVHQLFSLILHGYHYKVINNNNNINNDNIYPILGEITIHEYIRYK